MASLLACTKALPNIILYMKVLYRILPFALIAALLIVFLCLPKEGSDPSASEKTVVEIWNVDTFEGGKGSRTAFLNKAAARVGKEEVYFYVLSYTIDGVKDAFSRGIYPDMISYGLGCDGIAEHALPLPYSAAGGEVGGKCLAVPWAAGRYYRFSMTEDLTAEGTTAISCGGCNLSNVSACFHGIAGEKFSSQEAYIGFLNGEFRYLLGTQRDVCRFRSRNVIIYSEELSVYNDLFQYISVFSVKKRKICLAFVEELLSERTQNSLSDIGMYPPDEIVGGYTPSVFTSAEGLGEIESAADRGDVNFLEKYLKSR